MWILVLFPVLGLLRHAARGRRNAPADVHRRDLCEYLENTKESHYRVS